MSDVLSDLTIGIFDCDTHCYEMRDAFTKYMPKELLDRSIFPVRLPDGTETILADRRVAVFNSEQGLGFDLAYRPGSLKEMLKQMASGNPDETYEPMPMRPEFQERPARMQLLEAAGRRPVRALPVDHGAVGRAVRASTRRSPTPTSTRSTAGSTRRGTSTVSASRPPRCCRSATSIVRSPSSSTCSTGARASSCSRPGPRTGAHRATRTSTRSGRGSRKRAWWSRSTSWSTGTTSTSRRRGATTRSRRRGTCRRGSGRTPTASGRSRTRSRR